MCGSRHEPSACFHDTRNLDLDILYNSLARFFAAMSLAVCQFPCYTLIILVDMLLVMQAGSDGTSISRGRSIPRKVYRVLLGLFLLPFWPDGKRREKGRHLLHEKLQAGRNRRAASSWRRKECFAVGALLYQTAFYAGRSRESGYCRTEKDPRRDGRDRKRPAVSGGHRQ